MRKVIIAASMLAISAGVADAADPTISDMNPAVMKGLIDHVAPGRWDHIRHPNEKELAATSVLSIPIVEASAKIRSGDPLDDEADYALPIWCGQVPFATRTLTPVADARLDAEAGKVRSQLG